MSGTVLVPIYASRAVKEEDLLTNRKTTRRQSRAVGRSENIGEQAFMEGHLKKIGFAPVTAQIWEGAFDPWFRRPCKVA